MNTSPEIVERPIAVVLWIASLVMAFMGWLVLAIFYVLPMAKPGLILAIILITQKKMSLVPQIAVGVLISGLLLLIISFLTARRLTVRRIVVSLLIWIPLVASMIVAQQFLHWDIMASLFRYFA